MKTSGLEKIILLVFLSAVFQGCTNGDGGSTSDQIFLSGVRQPERIGFTLKPDPGATSIDPGAHPLITIKGPGAFISAEIYKQGGVTDPSSGLFHKTKVRVTIDGYDVLFYQFVRGRHTGLTEHNSYGVAVFDSEEKNVSVMTIGFPTPLFFAESLNVSVIVVETNVNKIVANVIYGNFKERGPVLPPPTDETQGGAEAPDHP